LLLALSYPDNKTEQIIDYLSLEAQEISNQSDFVNTELGIYSVEQWL